MSSMRIDSRFFPVLVEKLKDDLKELSRAENKSVAEVDELLMRAIQSINHHLFIFTNRRVDYSEEEQDEALEFVVVHVISALWLLKLGQVTRKTEDYFSILASLYYWSFRTRFPLALIKSPDIPMQISLVGETIGKAFDMRKYADMIQID